MMLPWQHHRGRDVRTSFIMFVNIVCNLSFWPFFLLFCIFKLLKGQRDYFKRMTHTSVPNAFH